VADKSLTELIRIYFKAYEAKDRSALESTLSGDFTFTSPHDDHIGRATYLERSKCISVRKSEELRTSSNSVLRTQDKSLESRSACSTACLASFSIGCQ
jgi:hypothetical protein